MKTPKMDQKEIDTLEHVAQTGYVISALVRYCKEKGIRFEQLSKEQIIKITSAAACAFVNSRSVADALHEILLQEGEHADS